MANNTHESKHWLYRRQNRPKLWAFMVFVLALTLLPEFFIHHHYNFEEQGVFVDGSWGFYTWYAFLSCVVMVVLAKFIGKFLKRNEDYYDD